MKKWIVLIISAGCCIALSAISLEESINMAKQNNKSLLIAAQEISKADEQYKDVRGSLLPQLNLQGSYSLSKTYLPDSASGSVPSVSSMLDDNEATDTDELIAGALDGIVSRMIPSSPQEEGSLAMQLKMDQVLFLGGKLINGIKAVDRYRSIQRLNYSVQEQDVILETTNMFYQTILARKVMQIQEEALATARRHLVRVELLGTEGQVSEFDLLSARLEVAKLEPGLLQAQNNYDLALHAFRKQLGSEDPNLIPEGEFVMPEISELSIEEAIEIAEQNRTELELLDIATEVKQLQYNAERSNFLPNVALSASAALYSAADEYRIESEDFGTQYSVGIGFSLPIFTGLSNRSKASYARHDLAIAKLQQQETKELVSLEVKQKHQKLQHALHNYEVQEQNITMAERNLELAQLRFDNQMGIQLEVFDAQTTLASIRLQYLSAVYDVISAEREFTKSLGYKLAAE
ncbi:MAG: TolC family protein [Candidatus Cloacimonetes bacterium]|jgi:outer membrane protein TolC|nr:TolC family protein [Candidatus Cloacimonadota bacterium]MDD2506670.1 TolC family protein [Candidatus Cloacimonadota bacterium]MDD4147852.1 TolC family protein [Candidatus Cloacimonadota bacterium]MDD4559966.1 TolC family protein [Candidatus Cloacimonadota bacterium]